MFLKMISFDLEVLPLGNQMPVPDKCPILLSSCHFNYDVELNGKKTKNIVYILTKDDERTDVQENRIVIYTKDETKIINGTFNLIKENDVVTGYNISGFDIPYIIDRAKALDIKNINIGLGDARLYYRKYLSKGFSVTKIGGLTGKIIFDVLGVMRREDATNVFKRDYNLKVLKLEHVSKEILGIEKLEFPVNDMIKYWNDTNDIELRNKFVDYCSRDSELALLLLTRFRLLDKFIALAKASGKIVQEIIDSQGSGLMVENLLLKEFRKYDRVIPIRSGGTSYENEKELEGAFVLDPKIGITNNIASLDYSSLYPSLIIKHNLCCSTLILEHNIDKLGLTKDDIETQIDEIGNSYAVFVKKEKYKGIVPKKLEELLDLRKKQKGEMKKFEKDSPEYLLWDSAQNATKILLNSFYGYSGDSSSKIYNWSIASSVTTNGRRQTKKTIDTIKSIEIEKDGIKYKLNVVAGDSIISDIPIIFYEKIDGKYEVDILPISELYSYYHLFNIFSVDQNKEIYVQSKNGFTLLKNVIKHRVTKKAYEIATGESYTKVTEDHSLFRFGNIIKPFDLNIGDVIDILHGGLEINTVFESENKAIYKIDKNLAWVFGFFCAEGTCGYYNCDSGKKFSWHIDNQDESVLERCRYVLNKYHERNSFKIIDIMKSTGVRRLMAYGDVKELVKLYRRLFYTNDTYGFKKIPKEILNADKDVLEAFLEGYYVGDGEKSIEHDDRFTTNSLTLFKGIEYITRKLYNGRLKLDVDYRTESSNGKGGIYKYLDRKTAFRGTIKTQFDKLNIGDYSTIKIKKEFNIVNENVYDLETENHTFVAGIGNIIHHNTDSSYINVLSLDGRKELSREEVVYCVNYAADKVNEILEKPMKLAFENYIKRIIIVAKKHYAYLSIDDKGRESITSKGLETVRRDWCNFSTDNMSKVIDFILKEKDFKEGINKSVELVKNQISALNNGKVDLRDLTLSKKLTKPITLYDNNAVHVQVAIKMKERGKPSQVGDRIQYIVLDNGKKLISDKAEEFDYVIANRDRCKIDYDYYIYSQLIPPTLRILETLGITEEILLSKMDEKQQSLDKWFAI